MRCFLSIGLRRFTGLGWFAHHAAGSRPGGCAMGTQGFGGVLATPLVGRGRRRQSATGSIVPVAEFDPNSATFGVWLTSGSRSSRNNIPRNRFFLEVVEIIN